MGSSKVSVILRQLLRAPTKWQRRWLVVCATTPSLVFLLIAIYDLYLSRSTSRLSGMASAISCLTALGMEIFLLRLIRSAASIATAEDRAGWYRGASFKKLAEMEKDRVKHQMRQETQALASVPDEREKAMQRDAEGHAFHILRYGLPGSVLVYWAVTLCLPVGLVRVVLLFSALAFSGLVIVVLSLPELIRVWMLPDGSGELYLLNNAARKEV